MLDTLGLTEEQRIERRLSVGASDARIIMQGDDEKLIEMWREKRGESEREWEINLLSAWGHYSEPLNRAWFEHETGRAVTDANKRVVHKKYEWLHVNLDGATTSSEGHPAVFEAKCLSPFHFNIDEIVAKYYPQLQHGMLVTGMDYGILSVFGANMMYRFREVRADLAYQAEMLEREIKFWSCVKSGNLPAALPPPPVPPCDAKREINMSLNNFWSSSAADWLESKPGHDKFTKAAEQLKKLMESDVGRAHGHGIQIKRASNGNLRITPLEG